MTSTVQSPQTVVLVGGGTMGADIAASFVACGWRAEIVNPPDAMAASLDARLRAAMQKLGEAFDGTRFSRHASLETVPWTSVDLVIEATPERLDVKQAVFRDLERLAKPDTPLCSNSSAIPIGRIGEGLATQRRMLGTHYFMPAHLVPAVEVVRSVHTDPAVADLVSRYLTEVGKVPVRVNRDIPGFLANRMQHALSREALSLIDRGIATAEDVDNAVRYGFGFRYIAAGPLLQRDHAGLDIHYLAARTIYPDLCNDAEPARFMSDRAEAGHIGMKVKRGFYEWTDEAIAAERARYEAALLGAKAILDSEKDDRGAS
jgi:3-hydroxybutyryl-CoA dehydrogenase